MSASVIRKEDAAGLKTWEMEAFGSSNLAKVTLPTADQIDRMHQSAHQEGFDQGYLEGGEHARAEASRLNTLLTNLQSELSKFDHMIAENVLRFALTLSQSIIRTSLEQRPELILSVVRDALAELPTPGKNRQLYLHPDDLALVSKHSAELSKSSPIELVEDKRLERGGCRIRSEYAEIDASLEKRWMHALAALGRSDTWLDKNDLATESDHDARS